MDGGGVFQVMKIGLRSTRLYDNDDSTIHIIPNNIMATKRITNVIRPDRKMRIRADLHIPYTRTSKRLKELLLDAALEFPDAAHESRVRPDGHPDQLQRLLVGFRMLLWVDDAISRKKAISDYRERAFAKLKKAGIDVPYPRTDAELHKISS